MPAISGTVRDDTGSFAARTVRVYRRSSGALVGEVISNATTGAWSVTTADTAEHVVLVLDGTVGDDHWADTVSLLHFDGVDGATSFIDEKGRTVSAVGSAQIDTARSVFGGSSLLLNGTSDYLNISGGTDFAFGTGDYSVQFRFYPTKTSTVQYIFSTGAFSTNQLSVRMNLTDRLEVFVNSTTGAISTPSSLSLNAWHAAEISRASGTTYLIVDGTLAASTTAFGTIAAASNVTIGSQAGTGFFEGSIDEFRATKGFARHTASYTVESTAFLHGAAGGAYNAIVYDRVVPV